MLSRSVGDDFGGCSHCGHRFAVKSSYVLKFSIGITLVTAMITRIDQIYREASTIKRKSNSIWSMNQCQNLGSGFISMRYAKKYKKDGEIYCYVYAKWQSHKPIFKKEPKAQIKRDCKARQQPRITPAINT